MTDEVAGVEFAGLENDGLENDGVERHHVYTAYDKVNANECARRVIISRTNPNTYLTPHSKLYGYCLGDLEQQCKACVSRFDSGAYDTLQFLRAVSHAAHTDALQPIQHADSSDDDCCQRVGRSVCTRSASCCRHTITVL